MAPSAASGDGCAKITICPPLVAHPLLSICSYSEELSRCQEEVRRLQGSLVAARDDCVSVSNERLQLQQENLQLCREMDELRKATLLAQKKAKQQVNYRAAKRKKLKELPRETKVVLDFHSA